MLSGLPSTYALMTYSLTVGMSTSPGTGGFNLDVNRGSLSNGDANTQVASNGRKPRTIIRREQHLDDGLDGPLRPWSVLFKLAVLSGNGNGTSGDDYDTYSITLSEEVSTNNDPVASDVLLTRSMTRPTPTLSYTYSDDDGSTGMTIAWYQTEPYSPATPTVCHPRPQQR